MPIPNALALIPDILVNISIPLDVIHSDLARYIPITTFHRIAIEPEYNLLAIIRPNILAFMAIVYQPSRVADTVKHD